MTQDAPKIITVEATVSDAETGVSVRIELESPNRMEIESAIRKVQRALMVATGGADVPF